MKAKIIQMHGNNIYTCNVHECQDTLSTHGHASFPTVVSFHGTVWSIPNFPANWTLYVGVDDVTQKLNIIIFTSLPWCVVVHVHSHAELAYCSEQHAGHKNSFDLVVHWGKSGPHSSARRRGIWGWTAATNHQWSLTHILANHLLPPPYILNSPHIDAKTQLDYPKHRRVKIAAWRPYFLSDLFYSHMDWELSHNS